MVYLRPMYLVLQRTPAIKGPNIAQTLEIVKSLHWRSTLGGSDGTRLAIIALGIQVLVHMSQWFFSWKRVHRTEDCLR